MRDNWIKEPISNFADVISGGTPSTDVKEFWEGDIVWITPADLSKIKLATINTSGRKISKLGLNTSSANLIPKKSIVMSSRAPIGYFAVSSVDFATNQGCKSMVLKENQDTYFHYYNFVFNVEKFKIKGEGTTFSEISKKEIEKIEFKLPPLPHQRKIAEILSTCDAVIEKTEAAIAKYQAIKQGLMHDLFTRGIDVATGKLRPKYEEVKHLYKQTELGWIPKEWGVKRLDEIVENLDGRRIPIRKEDRENMAGNIPYYGASGIIDYVNNFIFDEPLILLGEDGENVISRNLPLAFKITGKNWVNNHAHVLKPLKGIDIDFLTEYLESLDFTNIISGSAQPKINQANLNKKLLKIPNKKEQLVISARITSLVKKIQTEQSALSKYQQLKIGLMQDLLSGKVEVKV